MKNFWSVFVCVCLCFVCACVPSWMCVYAMLKNKEKWEERWISSFYSDTHTTFNFLYMWKVFFTSPFFRNYLISYWFTVCILYFLTNGCAIVTSVYMSTLTWYPQEEDSVHRAQSAQLYFVLSPWLIKYHIQFVRSWNK